MELLNNLAATYTTTRSYGTSAASTASNDFYTIIAIIVAYGFLILFIFALYYAITAILMGSLFKKAGLKSSIAWVPFYRQYKFLQIGGQNGRLVFLSVGAVAVYFISMILVTVATTTGNFALIPLPFVLISLAGVADLVFYIFRIVAVYNITKKLDKEPVMTLFFVIFEFIWWAIVLADKNTKFDDKKGAKRLDK